MQIFAESKNLALESREEMLSDVCVCVCEENQVGKMRGIRIFIYFSKYVCVCSIQYMYKFMQCIYV